MEGKAQPLLRENLDTLAQSGTAGFDDFSGYGGRLVQGEGSDMADKNRWKGRAKRKVITQAMILALVEVAKKKGEPEQEQAYWNAYHCQTRLVSHDGRIYGKYCKNRFCTICCSIRKAEILNRYLPVVSQWEDPHFVTLTVKAVPAGKLKLWLKGIQKAFRLIRQKYKKRNQRGKGVKLIGIKSLECNFNPQAKTYNPHLHLIVPNAEIAKILIVEWQQLWNRKGEKLTTPWAQHRRRVKDVEHDLIELIKYGSKIFTEPDVNYKAGSKIPLMIYAAALDTILCAMKPYRLFERFGFNLPKQAIFQKQEAFLQRFDEWVFDASLHDWHNLETGELLTGYLPSPQLRFLLGQRIDTDLR